MPSALVLLLYKVRSPVPAMPLVSVSAPASAEMVEAPFRETELARKLVPLTFSSAPVALSAPAPAMFSVRPPLVIPPCTCAVAPELTVMALFVLKAVAF